MMHSHFYLIIARAGVIAGPRRRRIFSRAERISKDITRVNENYTCAAAPYV